MPNIDDKLRSAALRYHEAASEVRKLTKLLGACDERGAPELNCTHPRRELDGEGNGLGIDCRKLTFHQRGEDGVWVRHRDREDWCQGCIEVQRIVDARRAAKLRRGHALTSLSNICRRIAPSANQETLQDA